MKNLKILVMSILMLTAMSCSKDKELCDCTAVPYKSVGMDFNKGNGKITICHNGNDLEIDESSWADHEAHGDVKGSCDTLGLDDEPLAFPYPTDCEDNGSDIELNGTIYRIECK